MKIKKSIVISAEFVRESGYAKRLFLIVLLLRPVLDGFYFLKNISPLLSPLYWVGVLSPIILLYIAKESNDRGDMKREQGLLYRVVCYYLLFTVAVSFIVMGATVDSAQVILRIGYFPVLMMASRYLVSNRRQLNGFMALVNLSTIVPISLLLFESLLFPLSNVQFSRGEIRYQGIYADVVSYGIYLVANLISGLYLAEIEQSKMRYVIYRIVIIIICLVGIKHVATAAVVITVLVMYLLYKVKANIPSASMLLILLVAGFVFFNDYASSGYESMLVREMEIFEGERPIEQAGHGRVSRWIDYQHEWSKMNAISKMVGVFYEVSGYKLGYFVLGAVHNDYLRMMYQAGVPFALMYIALLLFGFVAFMKRRDLTGFVIGSSSAWMILYSMSTIPTMYISMINIAWPLLSYKDDDNV